MNYEIVEKNTGWLAFLILIVISLGGFGEIIPLAFIAASGEKNDFDPAPGLQLYSALRVEGRDIYLREGCANCHTQMIRPFQAEVERYGHYSIPGEFVYDHPFLWGSRRIGPDLARIGSRYSNSWHQEHLRNPRAVIANSIMPAYPWLKDKLLDGSDLPGKMRTLNTLISNSCPKCRIYSEYEIEAGVLQVRGKTEEEALIAYLNGTTEQPGGLGRLISLAQ